MVDSTVKFKLLAQRLIRFICYLLILCSLTYTAKAQTSPFGVKSDLFDQSKIENLGLAKAVGTENITVFSSKDSTDHYCNGVVLTAFKGKLYCQWQSSAQDEDASDTWVAYSVSDNGKTWSLPKVLSSKRTDGYSSSGGWLVAGDSLVAFLNVWPTRISPRGGFTFYTKSADGINWTNIKPVRMADGDTLRGIFEQDPHALPNGRIINSAHFQPGLLANPIYTDDPSGTKGWVRAAFTNLSVSSNVSRELEPSWYLRGDGAVVMTFRDQNGTYKRLASVSTDNGATWSNAVLTDYPDSRAKQSCGNLPDGTAFMVSNPVNNKTRIPLAIGLSRDGKFFNTAYLLRAGGTELPSQRYTGKSKTLGYSYPKSIIFNGFIYVSYATNKDDAEITRVPISSLILNQTGISTPSFQVTDGYSLCQNYPNPFNPSTIIKFSILQSAFVNLKVFNLLGREVATLVNDFKINGEYNVPFVAANISSGIYYYRITAGNYSEIKKMILLK